MVTTIGFHPQTQKLEPPYKTPPFFPRFARLTLLIVLLRMNSLPSYSKHPLIKT